MKKALNITTLYVTIALIALSLMGYNVFLNSKSSADFEQNKQSMIFAIDSLNKLNTYVDYIDELLNISYLSSSIQIANYKQFYELQDNDELIPTKIQKSNKEFFVIRYSKSGCNSCIEMLFKNHNYLAKIKEKYSLIILVNFNSYNEFQNWKKSQISTEEKFFWVNEEKFPLDNLIGKRSYVFISNDLNNVHSIFIPNNLFPNSLTKYMDNVFSR